MDIQMMYEFHELDSNTQPGYEYVYHIFTYVTNNKQHIGLGNAKYYSRYIL